MLIQFLAVARVGSYYHRAICSFQCTVIVKCERYQLCSAAEHARFVPRLARMLQACISNFPVSLQVYNIIPSISSVTGISPQRYLWRTSIAFHIGPRMLIAVVYRNYYQTLMDRLRCSGRRLLELSFFLSLVEIVALCGVTYVSNRENYRKFFFIKRGKMSATVWRDELLIVGKYNCISHAIRGRRVNETPLVLRYAPKWLKWLRRARFGWFLSGGFFLISISGLMVLEKLRLSCWRPLRLPALIFFFYANGSAL